MRIAIQTWGSTGDTRPMFALAHGLRQAGHSVTLVATTIDNADFRQLARCLGLDYRAVPEQISVDYDAIQHTFMRSPNDLTLLRRVLETAYFPLVDTMYEASLQLCASHDLIISHFALHTAKLAAMETQTPHVAAFFWPGLLPSPTWPPYPLPNLGRWGNHMAWAAVWAAANYCFGREFLSLLRRRGVPLARAFPSLWYSNELNLYAASPTLWSPPAERNTLHQITGFWSVPSEHEPQPINGDLAAFLDEGEPPIYLGFGTPQRVGHAANLALLREAARRAEQRAVIRLSPEDTTPPGRDGHIFYVDTISHQDVFPRCAAILHHAGAGTTHTAARSGRPSIVVGFAGEQMSWGWKLHRLAAACRPIHRRRATPARLAWLIRQAVADPLLQRQAETLASRLRAENGVENAVHAIERRFPTC